MRERSSATSRLKPHFVPNEILCPKCSDRDFIRFEHVIHGSTARKLYFCSACEYEWVVDGRRKRQPASPHEE
jgi:rubredoxin